jgi:serine O-acetyltransferase
VFDDIKVIFERDPSAKNVFEVVLLYPGLHAIWGYRVSHFLHRIYIPFLPRLISQSVRFLTGIEIHPCAQIGRRVFIDHGMGVVIGETSIIGDDVTIYQGVTLGGTGKEKGKRHPTIQNGVVIGTGAKVLGNIVIGQNSRIGAGSVVVQNIPPESTVVGIPGRIVTRNGVRLPPQPLLEHQIMIDPLAQEIAKLNEQLHSLGELYHRLERENKELKKQMKHLIQEDYHI